MTQHDQPAVIVGWDEPEGLNPRGTVVILPGRGEQPAVYERFGRRISADAYRVRAVASPAEDPALTEKQVRSLLDGPKPVVLAGSDTGALFAVALVASGRLPEVAALVLAGLPTGPAAGAAASHPGGGDPADGTGAWHAELVSIADGRHDAFNDITHRTAAATIVLFLERLRNGADLAPIAVTEPL